MQSNHSDFEEVQLEYEGKNSMGTPVFRFIIRFFLGKYDFPQDSALHLHYTKDVRFESCQEPRRRCTGARHAPTSHIARSLPRRMSSKCRNRSKTLCGARFQQWRTAPAVPFASDFLSQLSCIEPRPQVHISGGPLYGRSNRMCSAPFIFGLPFLNSFQTDSTVLPGHR